MFALSTVSCVVVGITETRDVEMPYVNRKVQYGFDGSGSLPRGPCYSKCGLQTNIISLT